MPAPPDFHRIPAAECVRMSTEYQQYSTSNQADAIREYRQQQQPTSDLPAPTSEEFTHGVYLWLVVVSAVGPGAGKRRVGSVQGKVLDIARIARCGGVAAS